MKSDARWLSLALLSLFTPSVAFIDAHAGGLRAGLARVDITPQEAVTLAGYESRKEQSKGIHDPLFARALAFESDGRKLLLISTDNLGYYGGTAEPTRQAILEACSLKPSELFLCAIHTHSAPSLTLNPERGHANNIAYTKWLQTKVVELAKDAFADLQPVRFGLGSGSSPVGVNRREVTQDNDGKKKIVLGRNVTELTDREVQVLKLLRPDSEKTAGVLFAYATHSTSLGPKNYQVSGDIHGLAEQFLEKYLGAGSITPGFAGASGNIDPWVRVLPDFRTNNGWIPEPVLLGTMLGEEVARVAEGIRTYEDKGEIKTALKTIALSAKARGSLDTPTNGLSSIIVTAACLGDVAFVGWGGEVFNEVGKKVKEGSPFKCTFVFTHCNGTAGYVPIRGAYPEGGYEVQTSSFAPGAAEQLAGETLKMLRELR